MMGNSANRDNLICFEKKRKKKYVIIIIF